MPLYVFACNVCGQPFDKLVRSAAAVSEVTCPSCGSPNIKKQLTSFAATFANLSSGASAASCAPGGL